MIIFEAKAIQESVEKTVREYVESEVARRVKPILNEIEAECKAMATRFVINIDEYLKDRTIVVRFDWNNNDRSPEEGESK